MLKKELPLPNCETYFWSDSTAVLQSIYNRSRRFPEFVASRLAEIDRCGKARYWNYFYFPSALNPADDVSRGVTAKLFAKSLKWLSGPDFLWRAPKEWPKQLDKATSLATEPQDFVERIESVHSLLALQPPLDRFILHFSCLFCLKKATVWMLRYFRYIKWKIKSYSSREHAEKCQAPSVSKN